MKILQNRIAALSPEKRALLEKKLNEKKINYAEQHITYRAEKKEYYPLSFVQKRIYFLHSLNPDSISHNETNIITFYHKIDIKKLYDVLSQILNRHEILRTSFRVINDIPCQVINNNIDFKIEVIQIEKTDKETISDRYISPFNLTVAPLLRVKCLIIDENHTKLFIEHHQLICDDTSFRIFKREFDELFTGKTLPEIVYQYKDYSEIESKIQHKLKLKKQEIYWSELLKKEYLPIELNFKSINSELQDKHEVIGFFLNMEDTHGLINLAKEMRVTNFILISSVIHLLLSKMTNQEDIILGVLTNNRNRAEFEEMIGMFVNILAIRNITRFEISFKDFVEIVKKNVLAAFENKDFPFERIINKIKSLNPAKKNPLDIFINYKFDKSQESSNISNRENSYTRKISFDQSMSLVFSITEFKQDLLFEIKYNTRVLNKDIVDVMIENFKGIIRQVIENSEKIVADIYLPKNISNATNPFDKNDFLDFTLG